MAYKNNIKEESRKLRLNGFTHREISKKLGLSVGTAFAWTSDIVLTPEQKVLIQNRHPKATFSLKQRKEMGKRALKYLVGSYRKVHTKKELLEKIQNFYKKQGRIPLKREFNMYEEYSRHFGSWNKSIQQAGFEPNQVIFSKKYIAKDGHVCDSFAEKIIDDWLHKNKIDHERHIRYGRTKLTADFKIGEVVIEYFGLAGISSYDKYIEKKKALCNQFGWKLIELYPNDLFSKNFRNCLANIFKQLN